MQSTSCKMQGWMKLKMDSRLLGEISTISKCRWYHCNGRKWRGTKELLDEGERGEWKSWLKTQHSKNEDHGIRSHHFMGIDGETVEVSDFILGGSRITADGDCSHGIHRRLLCSLELNIRVPPEFICWSPNPQYDGMWKRGLCDVTRFGWGDGISIPEPFLLHHSVSPQQKAAFYKAGGGFSPEPDQDGTPISDFQLLEMWEGDVCCLSHPVTSAPSCW